MAGLPGIEDAGVVMGTDSNKELLEHIGLASKEVMATKPDELAIVVKAKDAKSADEALAQVDSLLAARKGNIDEEYRPHSLETAAEMLPDASWVIISVAGRYAAAVTREALRLGKHVHLFSDNVSVEEEIALKTKARELGLLVMGPDCGTAMIEGQGSGLCQQDPPWTDWHRCCSRHRFAAGRLPHSPTGQRHHRRHWHRRTRPF